MKAIRLSILLCLASLLAWPLTAADFTVESGVALPAETPDSFKALLKPEGVAVKDGDGNLAAEFWARQAPFTGEPASGLGIRMETIPEGAFIGLLRLPEGRSDYREQAIPAGLYSMRYSLHPEDGNHMGVASSRDFATIVPLAQDSDPTAALPFAQLVASSLQVGNAHPTILRLELPDGNESPHLWEDSYEHWVLDLDVAGEVVGLVVYGHSAE